MTMKRIVINVAIGAIMLLLISEATTVQALEQKTAYPHVIACEVKGVWHFAYLDRVEADGPHPFRERRVRAGLPPGVGGLW